MCSNTQIDSITIPILHGKMRILTMGNYEYLWNEPSISPSGKPENVIVTPLQA